MRGTLCPFVIANIPLIKVSQAVQGYGGPKNDCLQTDWQASIINNMVGCTHVRVQ